jgi:hypothetical protein
MSGQFMSDDSQQITNNPLVQSMSNIGKLFSGSTYFDGVKLVGNYYRPLMTALWAILYSAFGANPVPFHVVQLALYLLTGVLVFWFFRFSFKPLLALSLALLFLVHPLNSQSVYSISALQDVLFMLFGMLAMWVLLRFDSRKSLIYVAALLFLSLLSKETGILFVFMSVIYLYLFDRQRTGRLALYVAAPLALYLALKAHAVGLGTHPQEGPIDSLGLWGRLATSPSIILFYLAAFVWPVGLASRYYWTYPSISITHFLLPLALDLIALGAVIYGAKVVKRNLPHGDYLTYWFFAAWLGLGLAIHSQVIPLDMTACTNWFIFPMIGVLGLIGEMVKVLTKHWPSWQRLGPAVLVILLCALSLGSFLRGFDWRDQETNRG